MLSQQLLFAVVFGAGVVNVVHVSAYGRTAGTSYLGRAVSGSSQVCTQIFCFCNNHSQNCCVCVFRRDVYASFRKAAAHFHAVAIQRYVPYVGLVIRMCIIFFWRRVSVGGKGDEHKLHYALGACNMPSQFVDNTALDADLVEAIYIFHSLAPGVNCFW